MAFQSEKTGKHLRAAVLEKGVEERMRIVQSLNHCYGTGSRAALASMMLAALGATSETSDQIDWGSARGLQRGNLPTVSTGEIARHEHVSANDAGHRRARNVVCRLRRL